MPLLYLLDGYNFLHAIVLKGRERAGWWSPENQAKVVAWVVEHHAAIAPAEVWVVFDRRGTQSAAEADSAAELLAAAAQPLPIAVRHAPDADDYIVSVCAELAGVRELVVVSADRSLRDRALRHGARGASPWSFAR